MKSRLNAFVKNSYRGKGITSEVLLLTLHLQWEREFPNSRGGILEGQFQISNSISKREYFRLYYNLRIKRKNVNKIISKMKILNPKEKISNLESKKEKTKFQIQERTF